MSFDDILQSLLSAGDGVFVVDGDERVVHWNAAAQQLLGYARDDVVGQNYLDLLIGCERDNLAEATRNRRAVRAALSGTPVPNYDTCMRTQSGRTRWVNVSLLTLITSRNQETWLAAVLFRDASRQKLNEQFVKLVLTAAARLQDGVAPAAAPSALTGPPGGDLTRRERDVLALLARGMSTADIGTTLSLSRSTVRNHIQSILTKLHAHSRLEAVTYASEHGLLGNM
jgi:PAS domain S-box-containing protein